MMKTPLLYITHIFNACTSIQLQLKNVTKEEFDNSEILQGFVERKLEIIGEATKNIPNEFKGKHTQIPWKEMAGMRDILIHQYTEVDEEIVWKTITQKIPLLKKETESILKNLSK